MAEAEWLPYDSLRNCAGLLLSYDSELKSGKTLCSMRPTQNWLLRQGSGSRSRNKAAKAIKRRGLNGERTSLSKHPSRTRRQLDAMLYKQTCLFDAIDSEYPLVLPKASSTELRNATKADWLNTSSRLQQILCKFGTGLRLVERLTEIRSSCTLDELLRPFSSGSVFVLYATQLECHCGLLRNGQVSPYVVNRHTRAKRKTDDEYCIDFQHEFASALKAVPLKVLAFSLEKMDGAPTLANSQ